MSQRERIRTKYENYVETHKKAKIVFENIWCVFILTISALCFAIGFRAFISPAAATENPEILTLATGGISGVSQILVKTFQLIRGSYLNPEDKNTFVSIAYFALNVPIFILAWKGIGKRFAIFTMVNVIATSIFNKIIPESVVGLFDANEFLKDNFSRALFGGICIGLSSGLALMVDGSSGGLDVISYYIATKKSTSVGKYVLLFNGIVVVLFTFLSYFPVNASDTTHDQVWIVLLYGIVYLFVVSLVLDHLSRRNKKTQIQIITTKDSLPKVLMANFHHGCTVVDAKGAFSGEGKKIIYMVVSTYEVKRAIRVIQEADPQAFINCVSVSAVYGRFYVEPIK